MPTRRSVKLSPNAEVSGTLLGELSYLPKLFCRKVSVVRREREERRKTRLLQV